MDQERWVWSSHLISRMSKRKISRELIEKAVNEPDEIVTELMNRKVYQKVIENKLIRVVTEENKLITVYITSKVKKYMRGTKP
jgi:hypothetical protein